MIYLGYSKCGCLVAGIVDDPNDSRGTAKYVSKFIREGLTVEHVTVAVARTANWGCKCQKQRERLEIA